MIDAGLQPINQAKIQYNGDQYQAHLKSIQTELGKWGFQQLADTEYNLLVSGGGFIHNGFKYLYNDAARRYEAAKTAISGAIGQLA